MIKIIRILLLLILFSYSNVKTEIYQGILPTDNLFDIKNRFPSATFEKGNPAWAKEDEALYKIKGSGISGIIVVKLDGYQTFYKSSIQRIDSVLEAESLLNADTTLLNATTKMRRNNLIEFAKIQKEEYDNYTEDSMTVSWVRWVPDADIPLKRFIMKYGNPDSTNFTEDDLTPYKYWKRGITVYYDEEEIVKRVDYNFTYKDEKDAYLNKNNLESLPAYYDDFLRRKYQMPILPIVNKQKKFQNK